MYESQTSPKDFSIYKESLSYDYIMQWIYHLFALDFFLYQHMPEIAALFSPKLFQVG